MFDLNVLHFSLQMKFLKLKSSKALQRHVFNEELYSNFYDVNKLFLRSENKNTDYATKQRLCKCYKVLKITSNLTHNRQKRQKAQKDKKNSFQNELVENADLHKPVLNKIKTRNK